MIIIKSNIGKKIVKMLMTSTAFNNNYAVLKWDNSIVLRRTKPVDELTKIEITECNILRLKFKYHSSHSVLVEYVVEVEQLLYDKKQLLLNIWTTEQKEILIKKVVLNLTEETNMKFSEILSSKVFKDKYGDNYSYFISLHLNSDIIKVKKDDRRFSEVTLKYVLKPENKQNEMRHKAKIGITKEEASKLCSAISYWEK